MQFIKSETAERKSRGCVIRNVEGVVRAPFCEIRKGEGLDPVQVSDGVVQEALVPALEGHSHSDRAVLAAGRMDSTGSMVADTALA